MKTIEVSDEMHERLIGLSKEMNTQDHRSTAMPYFFQVKQTKRVFGIDSEYSTDGYVWRHPDFDGTVEDDIKSMREALEESCSDLLEDYLSDLTDDQLMSLMEERGYEKVYYRDEEVFDNAFLTEKACKEHIAKNDYHYSDPKDYLSHAFRNPELETICKFLCELTGGEIHK